MDIFCCPLLAAETVREARLQAVVAAAATNVHSGQPVTTKAEATKDLTSVERNHTLQGWSASVFGSTSEVVYDLHRRGLPEQRIASLLPGLHPRLVKNCFARLGAGKKVQKPVASARSRAFALGLFSQYWARWMDGELQRDQCFLQNQNVLIGTSCHSCLWENTTCSGYG